MRKCSSNALQGPRSPRQPSRLMSFAAALALFGMVSHAHAAASAKEQWGTFKDNGCVSFNGRKIRIYSSVLWGIPWGDSWELACSNVPASVTMPGWKKGVYFSHPTLCVTASAVDALATVSFVLDVGGLATAQPELAVGGALVGATALFMHNAGAGGLNEWGVFYVEVPVKDNPDVPNCP